ncbi:hypothetical protein A2U01_0089168, partial [Trifolium medium]|nr:hypothetical protein [Trifolium medium]
MIRKMNQMMKCLLSKLRSSKNGIGDVRKHMVKHLVQEVVAIEIRKKIRKLATTVESLDTSLLIVLTYLLRTKARM